MFCSQGLSSLPLAREIYFFIVGGAKGGVGKSIVTMSTVYYLKAVKAAPPLVIDADVSNPDVFKCLSKEDSGLIVQPIALNTADGWIALINEIEKYPDRPVVINTAGGDNEVLTVRSAVLDRVLDELKRELITLWPINRQRNSIEFLNRYIEAFPDRLVHVIKNGFFGQCDKFERYDSSKKVKAAVEAKGKALWLPDLAARVIDAIYDDRLSFEDALKPDRMPIGNRAELSRWIDLTNRMMAEIL